MRHVIVIGDLSEGISSIIGPFDDSNAAVEYTDTHKIDSPWTIEPIEEP